MKFLAIEHDPPGVPDAAFTPDILKAEAARAWELHQAGIIRELYFRADRQEAVLVLECADAAEAQAALDSLLLMQTGLIGFELMPLVAYPGFSRLFGDGSNSV